MALTLGTLRCKALRRAFVDFIKYRNELLSIHLKEAKQQRQLLREISLHFDKKNESFNAIEPFLCMQFFMIIIPSLITILRMKSVMLVVHVLNLVSIASFYIGSQFSIVGSALFETLLDLECSKRVIIADASKQLIHSLINRKLIKLVTIVEVCTFGKQAASKRAAYLRMVLSVWEKRELLIFLPQILDSLDAIQSLANIERCNVKALLMQRQGSTDERFDTVLDGNGEKRKKKTFSLRKVTIVIGLVILFAFAVISGYLVGKIVKFRSKHAQMCPRDEQSINWLTQTNYSLLKRQISVSRAQPHQQKEVAPIRSSSPTNALALVPVNRESFTSDNVASPSMVVSSQQDAVPPLPSIPVSTLLNVDNWRYFLKLNEAISPCPKEKVLQVAKPQFPVSSRSWIVLIHAPRTLMYNVKSVQRAAFNSLLTTSLCSQLLLPFIPMNDFKRSIISPESIADAVDYLKDPGRKSALPMHVIASLSKDASLNQFPAHMIDNCPFSGTPQEQLLLRSRNRLKSLTNIPASTTPPLIVPEENAEIGIYWRYIVIGIITIMNCCAVFWKYNYDKEQQNQHYSRRNRDVEEDTENLMHFFELGSYNTMKMIKNDTIQVRRSYRLRQHQYQSVK